MGQDDGDVTLADAQPHEEQEQRDTRDDVGVDHRDVVEERDGFALTVLQVVDADGRQAAQDRGDDGGDDGDDERVLDGSEHGAARLADEHVLVEVQ